MTPPTLPSLRSELAQACGLLLAGAVLVAVIALAVVPGPGSLGGRVAVTAMVVGADVALFVFLGRRLLERQVLRPVAAITELTGTLERGEPRPTVPLLPTAEFTAVAESLRRIEQRAAADRAERERAEKLASVGRLAAGIAHEVGNPLAGISNYAHLLRARVVPSPEASEALDALDREVERIDRIVGGILEYARPRRDGPGPFDLHDAIGNAIRILTDQGLLRRITMTERRAAGALVVRGSAHEFEQVLVNLLLNAADAMGGQGAVTLVTTRRTADDLSRPDRARADDGPTALRHPAPPPEHALVRQAAASAFATVILADSGPGVDPGVAERIFDPFFTTKSVGRGSGLGLSIVRRVVAGMGGAVWVERAREGGAAFHLVLPLDQR
jgi:hypothetical protein